MFKIIVLAAAALVLSSCILVPVGGRGHDNRYPESGRRDSGDHRGDRDDRRREQENRYHEDNERYRDRNEDHNH